MRIEEMKRKNISKLCNHKIGGNMDDKTTIKEIKQFIGGNPEQRINLINHDLESIAFDFCQAHPRVYKNPGKIEALINKMSINGSLWQ
jgi:hypothetical protein